MKKTLLIKESIQILSYILTNNINITKRNILFKQILPTSYLLQDIYIYIGI